MNGDEAFIRALTDLFGRRLRSRDRAFASLVYCAITQTVWTHERHGESGFTYRGANFVVAGIARKSFDFYMEDGSGTVAPEIAAPLFELGWHYEELR